MTREEFPETVTEQNMAKLVERAEKIKKRAFWLMVGISLLYASSSFIIMPILFYLVGWLFSISDPKLPSEIVPFVSMVTFFVSFFLIMFLLLDIIILAFEKKGWLPKSDEQVFSGCFLLANRLLIKENRKALVEIGNFIKTLSAFVRDRNNPKRKAYSKELKKLINRKTEISRLILFSDDSEFEKKTPNLLMKFGLSLVRDEDVKAHSELTELVARVKKFGEPQGRFHKYLGGIEKYPNLWKAIVTLTIFIISVILVFMRVLPSI